MIPIDSHYGFSMFFSCCLQNDPFADPAQVLRRSRHTAVGGLGGVCHSNLLAIDVHDLHDTKALLQGIFLSVAVLREKKDPVDQVLSSLSRVLPS